MKEKRSGIDRLDLGWSANGLRFSRADRDAMVAQLAGQESSGPRRLQP
jgi:hypothetical protein